MKILLVAPASNIHTQRWANGLAGRGLEVHVASIHPPLQGYSEGVHIHSLPSWKGVGYIFAAPLLQRISREIQPDIINAHYATGYGTLARLAKCSPLVLSVWGSDVYDFPLKSSIHRWWLRRNIAAAHKLASTSNAMAIHTMQFCHGPRSIAITPFGIDVGCFFPASRVDDGVIRIGTIKTLLPKYGIDTLLNAFAILHSRVEQELAARLRLDIAGEGQQRQELEQLAKNLGISEITTFAGRIPHQEVPARLATYDVYVALSRLDSESFGVAILEASACGLPVVVSNVDGLSEVVKDGQTGIVVPRENPNLAADALEKLLRDPQFARAMGQAGCAHVERNYSWESSLDTMIEVYRSTLASGGIFE